MLFTLSKYKSLKEIFSNYGLSGLLDYTLKNLNLTNVKKFNSIYTKWGTPQIQKNKITLNNHLFNLLNNKIFLGPYKNTKIINDFNEKYIIRSQQLLGSYEINVQNYSTYLQKKYKLKNIVNFGSDNGYHPLGLIKNSYFNRAICFERDKLSQKGLIKNFKINNISKKMQYYSEADFNKVFNLLNENELKKTLFIIDIEGDEYNLINSNIISKINNSCLIIENHDFAIKNKKKVKTVKNLLKKNFKLSLIEIEYPRIENYIYKINLKKDELILSLFEDRKNMNWIICEPKN